MSNIRGHIKRPEIDPNRANASSKEYNAESLAQKNGSDFVRESIL